uniref:Uncharacterized protein n=1 Tax=Parascaris univalens TaxID=6257 RepID=A0A914ZVU4_PARUN
WLLLMCVWFKRVLNFRSLRTAATCTDNFQMGCYLMFTRIRSVRILRLMKIHPHSRDSGFSMGADAASTTDFLFAHPHSSLLKEASILKMGNEGECSHPREFISFSRVMSSGVLQRCEYTHTAIGQLPKMLHVEYSLEIVSRVQVNSVAFKRIDCYVTCWQN